MSTVEDPTAMTGVEEAPAKEKDPKKVASALKMTEKTRNINEAAEEYDGFEVFKKALPPKSPANLLSEEELEKAKVDLPEVDEKNPPIKGERRTVKNHGGEDVTIVWVSKGLGLAGGRWEVQSKVDGGSPDYLIQAVWGMEISAAEEAQKNRLLEQIGWVREVPEGQASLYAQFQMLEEQVKSQQEKIEWLWANVGERMTEGYTAAAAGNKDEWAALQHSTGGRAGQGILNDFHKELKTKKQKLVTFLYAVSINDTSLGNPIKDAEGNIFYCSDARLAKKWFWNHNKSTTKKKGGGKKKSPKEPKERQKVPLTIEKKVIMGAGRIIAEVTKGFKEKYVKEEQDDSMDLSERSYDLARAFFMDIQNPSETTVDFQAKLAEMEAAAKEKAAKKKEGEGEGGDDDEEDEAPAAESPSMTVEGAADDDSDQDDDVPIDGTADDDEEEEEEEEAAAETTD